MKGGGEGEAAAAAEEEEEDEGGRKGRRRIDIHMSALNRDERLKRIIGHAGSLYFEVFCKQALLILVYKSTCTFKLL